MKAIAWCRSNTQRMVGVIVGAMALLMLVMATAAPAQASEAGKTIWRFDAQVTASPSSSTVTYAPKQKTLRAYDVTGDKKADTLKLQFTRTGKINIFINQQKAKTIKTQYYGALSVRVRYLQLDNGCPFLYITWSGDNMDGSYTVYQGKGGELIKVASNYDFPKKFATHRYLGAVKVSGNKLLVTYMPMTFAAGTMNMTYTFKRNKNTGVVKRTSNTTSKVGLAYQSSTKATGLHPVKRLTLYTSTNAKKVRGYAAKGKKLSITKVCLAGGANGKTVMFKVKTASGVSGWFKAPTTTQPYVAHTSYVGGGTLFRETAMAG